MQRASVKGCSPPGPTPSETTDATAARQRSSLYSRSVQRHISRAARSAARSGFLRNRNSLSLSPSLSLFLYLSPSFALAEWMLDG